MSSRRLQFLLVYQAVVYGAALLLLTGLVPDWGVWYSNSIPYRAQTEAFMEGRIAVSENIADLRFDHTWSEGGVHQVWGLGVPLWRLPFEALARLFGREAFPDRIAFGLFAVLASFVFLWSCALHSNLENRPAGAWPLIAGIGGVALVLLFPPFLTLLQVRGAIWEEAVAYEYLFGILLAGMLLAFVRQPVAGRWLILCALAGLGAWIRPTLIFYGFATVLIGALAWIAPARDRTWWKGFRFPARAPLSLMAGLFLFALGCGGLWWTNLARFGNGFEFGHKLNVQTLHGSMYATRFDDPFQDEPISRAGRELFGALFRVHQPSGGRFYAENIYSGQSPTVRWREFYFRTYDWTCVPLLLLAWTAALCLLRTRHADGPSAVSPAGRPGSPWHPIIISLGSWSLLSSLPLAIFYLYTPVISSRYMMDFAPAFAAALAGAWMFIALRCSRLWNRLLILLLLCAWFGWQIRESTFLYGRTTSVTWEELQRTRQKRGTHSDTARPEYAQNLEHPRSGIPFDRTGWDSKSGALKPLVILFVNNPDYLELELETQPHPHIPPNPEDIRAKIGLEHLDRTEITKTEHGWRVRFNGPLQPRSQAGIQAAFVATVPKEHLAEPDTPWMLRTVRWKDAPDSEDTPSLPH
jgi:hypothetical protein